MDSCAICGEPLGDDQRCGVCLLAGGLETGIAPPPAIGRYRILRLVGEGGMGAVYEAEQAQPQRIVALKVIKTAFITPELLRRFTRESEALARLHHPGIAQIYEGGTAEGDFGPQPYFAMEFIQGQPLDEYARLHRLNLRERLHLMCQICDAVEHAHLRGIIHRDLKPSNILVEASGHPKVLDFGVARMTDNQGKGTPQTSLGHLVGTLSYMSPEQVLGDPSEIDTRSDVYTLGVILYELLADRLPYVTGARLPEAVRVIREEDPIPLRSMNRTYRGDIDIITAKALEKERVRRYASAADLAEDIRRFMDHQPIAARRPSTVYQAGKFARRHRALVAGIAAVFVSLVAGIVASTVQLARAVRAERSAQYARQAATRERDLALAAESRAADASRTATASQKQADNEAATARAVANFLQYDLLDQAKSRSQVELGAKPDLNLTVRTALDRAAARIEGKFKGQPTLEASIRKTIAESYMSLGLYPEALSQAERAFGIFRRAGGADKAVAQTLNVITQAYINQSKYSDAEPLLVKTLELERRTIGVEAAETLQTMSRLSVVYCKLAQYRKAEQFARSALEGQRRTLGDQARDTIASQAQLASALQGEGRLAEAEQLCVRVRDLSRRALGEDHPFTLNAARNLADSYAASGKYGQAFEILTPLLDAYRRVRGADHPGTLHVTSMLAAGFARQGRLEEAVAMQTRVLETARRTAGDEDSETLFAMANLAHFREVLGDFGSAEPLWSQVWELRHRQLGPLHPDTMSAMAALAYDRLRLKKYAEAEPLLRASLNVQEKADPDSWVRFTNQLLLGASLAGQSRYAEAEPLLVGGYNGLLARESTIPRASRSYLDAGGPWIVRLYQDWGAPEKAAAWTQKLQIRLADPPGQDH